MGISTEKARAAARSFYDIVFSYTTIGKYVVTPTIIEEGYTKKLESTIEKMPDKCDAVWELTKTDFINIAIFKKETGKRYLIENEAECARFMNDYFKWLSEQYTKGKTEPEVIEDIIKKAEEALPDIPSIPSIPAIETSTKAIITVILVFVGIVVLLVALGYAGVGKPLGAVVEREHERKRG